MSVLEANSSGVSSIGHGLLPASSRQMPLKHVASRRETTPTINTRPSCTFTTGDHPATDEAPRLIVPARRNRVALFPLRDGLALGDLGWCRCSGDVPVHG